MGADFWRAGRPNVFTGQLANVLKAAGTEPDFRYAAALKAGLVHMAVGEDAVDEDVEVRMFGVAVLGRDVIAKQRQPYTKEKPPRQSLVREG